MCVCVFRLFHVVRKFISITFFVLCCSHDLSISRYILTMFREKSANFFLLVLFNDFSDSLTAAENAWAINAAKLLQINMKQSNVSQHFSGVSTFFDMSGNWIKRKISISILVLLPPQHIQTFRRREEYEL